MGSPLVARLVVADAELWVLAPIRTGGVSAGAAFSLRTH